MADLAKQLGENIRKRRVEIGLSQDNLALNANIDRSYIGRIERGEVNITVEMLFKIAAYIKIDPRDLLPIAVGE
ncbi:XRE family transcriptional regulator [Alishewanella sp. WH16-1]|uniref:helix-turn-helix domain-containing protein n=1 Tax=Alishewanella sp. WH16-1 TaxID=1651088 RepID=UPI000710C056|nr:helix-turn-helix transcriptional regulator [Alishewanella sp. WH16-1]KRS21902.1 XRE family transcriptional regulator [Alishewanella sp. WH16-1]